MAVLSQKKMLASKNPEELVQYIEEQKEQIAKWRFSCARNRFDMAQTFVRRALNAAELLYGKQTTEFLNLKKEVYTLAPLYKKSMGVAEQAKLEATSFDAVTRVRKIHHYEPNILDEVWQGKIKED